MSKLCHCFCFNPIRSYKVVNLVAFSYELLYVTI
ncbi:hypothetical protein [Enterococcus phage vB_Efs8_KEN04]|uniref:Uncharacterized protein n=1 Tax=Enterococcus phage vB_Efs6_KEN16 TaxID=3138325 RepID=A0AAX4PTY4_9CAUD